MEPFEDGSIKDCDAPGAISVGFLKAAEIKRKFYMI